MAGDASIERPAAAIAPCSTSRRLSAMGLAMSNLLHQRYAGQPRVGGEIMVKAMGHRTRTGAGGGIAFPPYRFEPQEGCLWRGSRRVPLSATDTAILAYLVSRAGRLVTRDELL